LTRSSRLLISALIACAGLSHAASTAPSVGDIAPDFSLQSLTGETVRLSELTAKSPVVLLVLRGYPGYQCPLCQRQVRDFAAKAQEFAQAGVAVVMIYPGPMDTVDQRAKEFLAGETLPDPMRMLLDPDYTFTNAYGLRWNAKGETAYPSTFLIDRTRTVWFSKSAKSHGGRTTAAEILDLLPKKKSAN
jgi:peroxiredoxin